ncbi:MAG: amidohydrolase [Candidatus Acidiferrales bacterium]
MATFAAIIALALAMAVLRSRSEAELSPTASADFVLLDGDIYTGISSAPRASAIAIRGESIIAIAASDAEIKSSIGPRTRVVDLHGQFAMPGWNDAHVHLAGAGYTSLEIELLGVRSIGELQQRVRAHLADYSPGQWILGDDWDHTLWPEKKFPTRADLDVISSDHPIYLERVDGHVAVVNSLALKIAGITSATPDPPAGRIERDANGQPDGMLLEDAAMDLVYSRVPPYSQAQRLRAFTFALDDAARFGVTSVQDNSVQDDTAAGNYGWGNFQALQQLRKSGKLKVRVSEWLPFTASLARLKEMRQLSGGGSNATDPGDPWLKTAMLKGFLDGSLGSRTAAMLAPYSDDPSTSGIPRIAADVLTRMSIERDRAGFQIGFHAIGDRANREALDAFAAVLAANGPRDRRDRVEHAQIVSPEDMPRFAALSVIPSMQPSHLLDDERWAADRLGPERAKGAYAWHTLQESGAHLAFGTDYSVEPIDPLRGLYACVTRKLPDGSGPPAGPYGNPSDGWEPQEKLSADDCIHAYTAGSAYAQFEEKRKGVLAPGMLADIVVYPADITKIAPLDLLRTRVSLTIVGGRIVYQKP